MNICFSVDYNEYIHLLTIINSISKNTAHTNILYFYILVDAEKTLDSLKILMLQFFPQLEVTYSIIRDTERQFVLDNMRIANSSTHIENVMNFARFYLSSHFAIDKFLYLDVDMIFQCDIITLIDDINLDTFPLWAVPLKDYKISYLKKKCINFIAGLYFVDCKYWHKNNITSKCEQLMIDHKKSTTPLFDFGTQPIINIVFAENYGHLDPKWNINGLGGNKNISKSIINSAKVLHWNGPFKPWNGDGYYKDLWKVYIPS